MPPPPHLHRPRRTGMEGETEGAQPSKESGGRLHPLAPASNGVAQVPSAQQGLGCPWGSASCKTTVLQ